jgi:hypothetical protein
MISASLFSNSTFLTTGNTTSNSKSYFEMFQTSDFMLLSFCLSLTEFDPFTFATSYHNLDPF